MHNKFISSYSLPLKAGFTNKYVKKGGNGYVLSSTANVHRGASEKK